MTRSHGSARSRRPGLLIAFVDFLTRVDAFEGSFGDLDALLTRYPRQSTTAAGKRANTLIVKLEDGKTLSLRPFYNAAERFFRAEQKRFDYPSCAPHATQAWGDYGRWLDSLVTYSAAEVAGLRESVVNYVLGELKSQAFDPSAISVEPSLFRLVLEGFDLTARKGEPTGAAFQGIVFGFLRADNPHLQVEIGKVRTGSKRLQRVGDIDAWEGGRLAITAEVKQYELKADGVVDLTAFANEAGRRGAIGIVFALEVDDASRDALEGLGVEVLSVDDMLDFVRLWDPMKQRIAVSSFVYYVKHVEKNSSLAERLDAFLEESVKGGSSAPSEADL